MASAWSEEEAFVCSVCLETLKDPATLPCGHSYCLACIRRHWDKGGGRCSCPQCRQVFNPRPSLAKSTVLVEAMEKLRSNSLRLNSPPVYLDVGSVYPRLPSAAPKPCPRHGRPLDLFCRDDRECVCEDCCQDGHEGHSVLKPEDERKDKQKELLETLLEAQRKSQETVRELEELPHVARQHKASFQGLQREKLDICSDLTNDLSDLGTKLDELLDKHEATFGSQIEGQIHRLEQKVAQLSWKNEELNRLAGMQDDVCFLKNFHLMAPLSDSDTTSESILSKEKRVQECVRAALKELQECVGEVCRSTFNNISALLNEGASAPTQSDSAASTPAAEVEEVPPNRKNTVVYEMQNPPVPPRRPESLKDSIKSEPLDPRPSFASAPPAPLLPPPAERTEQFPEPKTRGELLKFRVEPSLDPNSAYRHLLLADLKATMRAENVNATEHPERFQFWRQILCKEPLGGSPYYWEVEWSGQKFSVAVAYKDIERKTSDDKSRLGHNPKSWSLYWSGTGFSFWHDSKEKLLGSPKSKRIGVYLDQHAGVLAFYRIAKDQAELIHRHQTQFCGALYPGFRFSASVGSSVTMCQLD